MNTLGEFIDHIEKKNSAAEIWIGAIMYRPGVSQEHRDEYRNRPFNKESVTDFALALADEVRQAIMSGSSDEYIQLMSEEGHEMLQFVHAEASRLGILAGRSEIDVPLSLSESLSKAYFAR